MSVFYSFLRPPFELLRRKRLAVLGEGVSSRVISSIAPFFLSAMEKEMGSQSIIGRAVFYGEAASLLGKQLQQ